MNQKIDSVLSSCEETTEYSRNHNEKMTAILDKKITGNIVWTTRTRRVVAPLIAAVFILTTCILFYHNQSPIFNDLLPNIIGIGNTNMNKEPSNGSPGLSDDSPGSSEGPSIQETINDIYALSYLPDGYTLTESKNRGTIIVNTYHNENDDELIFAQYLEGYKPHPGGATLINTYIINDFEVRELIVNSKFVYLWKDSNYSMEITSVDKISKTELEKIIDGIIIVE